MKNETTTELLDKLKNLVLTTEYLNVKELAVYCHVKEKTVYGWIYKKVIPHYTVMGKPLFRRNEIDEWISATRVRTVSEIQTEAALY